MGDQRRVVRFESDWDSWKAEARRALLHGESPNTVRFAPELRGSTEAQESIQVDLFSAPSDNRQVNGRTADPKTARVTSRLRSSKQFELHGRRAAHHRSPERFDVLYRVLWRMQREGSQLLKIASDPDIAKLENLARQVKRDAHKAKAFVRFRKVRLPTKWFEGLSSKTKSKAEAGTDGEALFASNSKGHGKGKGEGEGEVWYVAFHRSDHDVLPLVADFFADRFAQQRWSIVTPLRSMVWDLEACSFHPGVASDPIPVHAQSEAMSPQQDRQPGVSADPSPTLSTEFPTDSCGDLSGNLSVDPSADLWRSYYRSIFNPARANPKAMLQEMPSRYWSTMPESRLIPELLREAGVTTRQMLSSSQQSIRPRACVPDGGGLAELSAALPQCRACTLCENGTRPVFGEGPATARLMIVGEAPGDVEETLGRPFVGPAGKVLRDCMEEVGLQRSDCYLTNAVKHFKFKSSAESPLKSSAKSSRKRSPQDEPPHHRSERGNVTELDPSADGSEHSVRDQRRRIHQGPSQVEVSACRPWVAAEMAIVQPAVVLCLGATAARSLVGPEIKITRDRGRVLTQEGVPTQFVASYHPAHLLRIGDPTLAKKLRSELVADLKKVLTLADSSNEDTSSV